MDTFFCAFGQFGCFLQDGIFQLGGFLGRCGLHPLAVIENFQFGRIAKGLFLFLQELRGIGVHSGIKLDVFPRGYILQVKDQLVALHRNIVAVGLGLIERLTVYGRAAGHISDPIGQGIGHADGAQRRRVLIEPDFPE